MAQPRKTAQIKETGTLGPEELARLKRLPVDFGDRFFVRLTEGPEAGKIVVDPARAYPRYLKELEIAEDQWDQYALTLARLIMTEDLANMEKLAGRDHLHLQILKNDAWRLSKFPAGRGEGAAAGDVIKVYERLARKRGAMAAIA